MRKERPDHSGVFK